MVAQPGPTLDELIDEALHHNARLLAERYNLPIAEARIIQARLRPNPTVQVQWQYTDTFGVGFSAAKNPAGPPEFDLGFLYPYVRGGKRAARIELANSAKRVAEADMLDKSRTLIFDVQSAYVELLLARETAKVVEDSRQKLEQVVEVNRARVKAGDLAEVELNRSELAALQFANQAAMAEMRLRAARLRLQSLVGRSTYDPQFDVAGGFRRLETLPTQEALLAKALENRPDLMALRRDIERSRANQKLQVAASKPDWNVGALFSRQYNIGIKNGSALTYTAYIPLAIADKNQGGIEQARQESAQIEAQALALQNEVRLDVASAYSNFDHALQLLRRYEGSLLDRAEKVRTITEYSYRRGEASLLEYLDAQRAYNETFSGYQEARAEHARTLYLLDAVTGTSVQ